MERNEKEFQEINWEPFQKAPLVKHAKTWVWAERWATLFMVLVAAYTIVEIIHNLVPKHIR